MDDLTTGTERVLEREKRLVQALVHALVYYIPSVSAEAEVLSYLNGYDGDGDIMEETGLAAELLQARIEQKAERVHREPLTAEERKRFRRLAREYGGCSECMDNFHPDGQGAPVTSKNPECPIQGRTCVRYRCTSEHPEHGWRCEGKPEHQTGFHYYNPDGHGYERWVDMNE